MVQEKPVASYWVMGSVPLLPATILAQFWSTLLPSGETMPMPVMTTRRLVKISALLLPRHAWPDRHAPGFNDLHDQPINIPNKSKGPSHTCGQRPLMTA